MRLGLASSWTREQKNVVTASVLGWTLDAFDFFLFVFVLKDMARDFGVPIARVTVGILVTLAMRPIGALIFGRAADHYGRRPTLMVDIVLYSVLEFACGFAPNLTVLLVLRALFGVAMGGEWGVAASLTMETIPASSRGLVSGLLQAGYPAGYLIAAVVYAVFFPIIGWRGMFMLGVLPALLVLYIRRHVAESPSFQRKRGGPGVVAELRSHWRRVMYAVVLMTAFNFFSHGTQDLYPTFLQVQHDLSPRAIGAIAVVYNIGAILGGVVCGTLSERYGRRRTIIAAALLALPMIPLWAWASDSVLLALGAFCVQFMVQGAWGVIPVHLNELSPEGARGTFPGVTYQLGNLLASVNATLQAGLAEHYGGNYALALTLVAAIVAVAIVGLTAFGAEAKGVAFAPAALGNSPNAR